MPVNEVASKTDIRKIYENMEYGKVRTLNCDEAIAWLKSAKFYTSHGESDQEPNGTPIQLKNAITGEDLVKVYEPGVNTIETVLKNTWDEVSGFLLDPVTRITRAKLLYRLGNEIKKNENMLCQLETLTRGISARDTKNKSIPLLVDYLQYYSGFCVKQNHKGSDWAPKGLSVGIFPDESPLFLLGCFLGPTLAAGYNVVIQADARLNPIFLFILKLARQTGFPDGCIRLIGGNPEDVFFKSVQVATISIFDNLLRSKYAAIRHNLDKKLLYLSTNSCPYIVFEDADLDSACQNLIQAAWGHQGLTPWSVRNVFVQENVLKSFTQKLKNQILKIKLGSASTNDKNVDVTYPYLIQDAAQKLEKLVDSAKSQGIEVFQGNHNFGEDQFRLTLFIGGQVCNNNVLKEEAIDVPTLTITAFRSINEGVNLANNSRQGFAASAWTSNLSLANEISHKLKVCNVWINCHGLFSADAPIVSDCKSTSNGYFGGKEGFYEFFGFDIVRNPILTDVPKTENGIGNVIAAAKQAQSIWSKLSRLERSKKLYQLVDEKFDDFLMDSDTTTIYNYAADSVDCEIHGRISAEGFKMSTIREPLGVVMIETKGSLDQQSKNLLVSALIEGNSVIVSSHINADIGPLFSILSRELPKGLCTLIPLSLEIVRNAAYNVNVSACFLSSFGGLIDSNSSLPLKESGKFKVAGTEDIRFKCTSIKNVWSNVGQSIL